MESGRDLLMHKKDILAPLVVPKRAEDTPTTTTSTDDKPSISSESLRNVLALIIQLAETTNDNVDLTLRTPQATKYPCRHCGAEWTTTQSLHVHESLCNVNFDGECARFFLETL